MFKCFFLEIVLSVSLSQKIVHLFHTFQTLAIKFTRCTRLVLISFQVKYLCRLVHSRLIVFVKEPILS